MILLSIVCKLPPVVQKVWLCLIFYLGLENKWTLTEAETFYFIGDQLHIYI